MQHDNQLSGRPNDRPVVPLKGPESEYDALRKPQHERSGGTGKCQRRAGRKKGV